MALIFNSGGGTFIDYVNGLADFLLLKTRANLVLLQGKTEKSLEQFADTYVS